MLEILTILTQTMLRVNQGLPGATRTYGEIAAVLQAMANEDRGEPTAAEIAAVRARYNELRPGFHSDDA